MEDDVDTLAIGAAAHAVTKAITWDAIVEAFCSKLEEVRSTRVSE